MADVITCSVCGAKHRLPDHLAGRADRFECPDCGGVNLEDESDDEPRPAAARGRGKLGGMAILGLAGILAFVAYLGGTWYFEPEAAPPVAARPPAPPAPAVPAPPPGPAPDAQAPIVPPPPEDIAGTPAAVPFEGVPTVAPDDPDTPAPTPDVNPRLTRSNFDKIHDGMTEERVKALLGDPTGIDQRTGSDGRRAKILQWAQRDPFAMIEVVFLDGRSEAKTTTLPPGTPPGKPGPRAQKPAGSSGLTRTKFDLIKSGMTEDEVTAILGPPHGTSTHTITSSGQTNRTRMLVWRQKSPNVTITVTLRNEKVSGKNCIQIGPIKP